MTVPPNERFTGLKQALFDYLDEIARIQREFPNLTPQQPLCFTFLTSPWLVDIDVLTEEQRAYQDRLRLQLAATGFDGQRAKAILNEVLAKDLQLRECCLTPLQLAGYLDAQFLAAALDMTRHGAGREHLEFAFQNFESATYGQRFMRIALSHLFNFDMQSNSLIFKGSRPLDDIRIERLNPRAIPPILGETDIQGFLHTEGIGNCYVIEEEGASDSDDFEWLSQKRQRAWYFAQVLQYFKGGVVHLGYSVPMFFPEWARKVRHSGLFFLGELRRLPYEGGSKPYTVDDRERQELDVWWKAATVSTITEALANQKGKLRQAIWRAGHYYEDSHRRTDPIDRLIAVAIGFEALFSPSDQGELNFRICQTAAQFVGKTPSERQQIFSDLKRMYSRRSQIVHGTYNLEKYLSGQFVRAEELDAWAEYLRQAVVGFLALYLSGENDAERDPVLGRITEINFDESKRAKLREDSDLDKVLRQTLVQLAG